MVEYVESDAVAVSAINGTFATALNAPKCFKIVEILVP